MRKFAGRLILCVVTLFVTTPLLEAYTTHHGGNAAGVWSGTHYITSTIVIEASDTLTLSAGCVIKCAPSVEIWGYGVLIIAGTATDSVFITSRDDDQHGEQIVSSDGMCAPGDWLGIWQSGNINIAYAVFLYGGGTGGYSGSNLLFSGNSASSNAILRSRFSYSQADGVIFSTAVCTVDSSNFSNNSFKGIYAYANNTNHIIARYNTFINNGGAAAQIDNAGDLLGNTGSGNSQNCILTRGSIAYTTTWTTKNAMPIILNGNLNVETGGILTLSPGTIVKCSTEVWFTVYSTLIAIGTAADSIVITSVHDDAYGGDANGNGATTMPAAGDWKVLNVFGAASFLYCRIRYGGNIYGNIQMSGAGTLKFAHNTSEYSGTAGLICANTTMSIDSNTFKNNTGNGLTCWYNIVSTNQVRSNCFTSNGGYAAQLSSAAHGVVAGNYGAGNGTNAIQMGGEIAATTHWSSTEQLPLLLTGWFYIPAACTLNIDSGVINTNSQVFYGPGTFSIAGGSLETELASGLNGIIWCSGYSFGSNVSYRFSGTSAQVTGNYLPDTVLALWIDNPAGVSLSKDVCVSSMLTLDTGKFSTGAYSLTIGINTAQTGDIIQYGGYVAGAIKRFIATAAASYQYPVGNASSTYPVTITFTTAPSFGGLLSVVFMDSNPGSNGVNLALNPVRDGKYSLTAYSPSGYWGITSIGGLTGGVYSIAATARNFAGFSSLEELHLMKRNNSSSNWIVEGSYTPATGTLSLPVLHRTGLQEFSEFGVGTGAAIQADSITVSGVMYSTMLLSVTPGNGEKRAIFMKTGSTGSASPIDDSTYVGNSNFGAGTPISTTGWYCVYNGAGNSVLVTGLQGGTEYRIFASEYNGISGSERYNIDSAYNNPKSQVTAPAPAQLLLTVFIEGLFDGTTMVPDTLRVYLRPSGNVNIIRDATTVLLGVNGTATGMFSSELPSDTSYYLVLEHRSAVETWSAQPQYFTANVLTYDFSTTASKAYGDNQILKNGKYCLFSGDINRDGLIDLNDMILVDNDNAAFTWGYTATDINGDAIVDLNDMIIIDNNNAGFVGKITPGINRGGAR